VNKQERERFVLELMQDTLHSYGFNDWSVKLTRATKTIAYVNASSKVMAMSMYWAVLLPDDLLIDTLLHEVAHVITRDKFGAWAKAHGPEWRSVCYKIGCKGERGLKCEDLPKTFPRRLTTDTIKHVYQQTLKGER